MTRLVFPESAADLSAAFNNALEAGVLQDEHPAEVSFWGQHEFVAHDADAGTDIFYCKLSAQYVRVPRKEEST